MEYERADVLVVPSAQAAETFAEHGLGAEKVVVNVTGVDLARFAPVERPDQAGESEFTLVYIGVDPIRKGAPGRPGSVGSGGATRKVHRGVVSTSMAREALSHVRR